MADKGFQQYIQESNFNPSPIVTKLDGKGQTMETAASLGKMAVEGYVEYDKNKQLGSLDDKLAELNDEYFSRDISGINEEMNVLAQERAVTDLQMQNLTQNPTFQTGEEVDAAYSGLQATLGGLDESLAKLQMAKNQGSMSSFEYDQRAKKITRELVANNPHLTREILGRLSQNLNLSGMEERIKYDEALRKQQVSNQEDEVKFLRKNLESLKIPESQFLDPMTGQWDTSSMRLVMDSRRSKLLSAEMADEALKNGETLTKTDAFELVRSGKHLVIADGKYEQFKNTLADLKQQYPDYAQFKVQASIALARAKESLTASFGGIIKYNPEIEMVYNQTVESFNELGKVIDSNESGETLTKYMENRDKVTTLIETNNLRKKVGSLEAIKLQNQLMSSSAFIKILDEDKGTALKILERLIDVSAGARQVVEDSIPLKPGDVSVSDILRETTSKTVVNDQGTGNSAAIFNTSLADELKVITSNSDEATRFVNTQKVISNLADPTKNQSVVYLNNENKVELERIIQENNVPLFSKLVASKESGVTLSLTPDGLVTTTNATSEFRTSVVDRINDSIKAYAALKGTTTKEVAQDFYTKFYKDTFDNKDIPKVDYLAQARETMPRIALKESGGKFYTQGGQYITSPVGAFGKYQIMPMTGLRPAFGVKPLNYNLQGAAFDKDQERFATEYYAANLKHFNGDEKKALAGYNWGHGNVDKLVAKYGNDWLEKGIKNKEIPKETVNYVSALSSKATKDVNKITTNLMTELAAIEKNHPQIASTLYKTPAEKAKYISERLNEEEGVVVPWEQIAKTLMPESAKVKPTGNPMLDLASVLGGKNYNMDEQRKKAFDDAIAIKNSPSFGTLSKEEQDRVWSIIDPGLEGVYPEALIPVGKAVSALATRLGIRKAATTPASSVPVREVPTPTPIKELMKKSKASSTEAEKLQSSTARAAEKVARDRVKPINESAKRVEERNQIERDLQEFLNKPIKQTKFVSDKLALTSKPVRTSKARRTKKIEDKKD
jgi:hypothetical protein